MTEQPNVHGPKSKVARAARSFDCEPLSRPLLVGVLGAALAGCTWLPGFARPSAAESTRLIDEARKANESGENERARQLLTRAAEIAPDDPEIQRGIGRGLLLSGARDEGLKHLRYGVRGGVDDPDAYLELAHVLMDAARYDECQEMIDAALRIVPTHAQAQLMKGRLAELRHDDDEALETYYRLLGHDPTDIEAMLRVAEVLVRQDQFNQAAPLLRTVVDSDRVSPSDQARAHWVLGLIYGRDHRWSESAAQFTATRAIRSELSADECYQVAYAYWQAGDQENAREFVSRTLALNPAHADALALAAAFGSGESATQTAYSRLPVPTPKGW